jgi:uncharacterized protein (TIGR02271 family)
MDEAMDGLVSLGDLGVGEDGGLRGRPVFAGDGTLLGEVADVLGDPAGGGPRFVAVALEASVARTRGGRQVYVPYSGVRVDESRRVHLDGVTGESAVTLPSVPGSAVSVDPDATVLDFARAADSLAATGHAAPAAPNPDEARVTLSEEELMVGTRTVQAGEVSVHKHVETARVRESVPVMREEVTVERRPLAAGAGLEARTEGNVTYIPIVEEEVVVTKRLVAREELVITKRQVTEQRVVEETVRREVAEVRGADVTP